MSSYRMKYRIGNTDYHIPVQQDISSGIPIATVLPYASNLSVPEGFFLCDGRALSRSVYPVLFSRIGTVYGEGDGSTTFNIPDFTGRFAEGALTAGVAKSAGLPNIEGFAMPRGNGAYAGVNDPQVYGAFYIDSNIRKNWMLDGTTASGGALCFDASRSNSIYGNSQTVQPPSLTVKYIIKAYDASPSQSQSLASSLGEYLTDISNKGYRDLSNLTQAGEDHFLEKDWCYIYPNNGTESNPANISSNNRYVMNNPFSGYMVRCQAEVYYSNEWGVTQYSDYYSSQYTGIGVYCYQHNDDNLVLVSGTYLLGQQRYVNTVHPSTFGNLPDNAMQSTLPCRVKVWKIGKIPT